MLKIITDSTSDLDKKKIDELGVEVVPLYVTFGEEIYKDGIDIDNESFYKKLKTSKVLPKTSQVNVGEFYEVFKKHIENGDEILGIFASASLSGTFQSAVAAREMLDQKEKISLVNSNTAAIGLEILIRHAVNMKNNNHGREEIFKTLEKLKEKIRIIAMVSTLKYLQMGGRLSKTSSIIGSILKITPILSLYKGEIIMLDKKKGKNLAMKSILMQMKKFGINSDYPILLTEGEAKEDMEKLKQLIEKELSQKIEIESKLGSVIGTHVGPGAIACAFVED
ncbi:MAG: DegV family protein [Tissierellia bacterium]|nr:DegV family protein [Tissierellia bacterium]